MNADKYRQKLEQNMEKELLKHSKDILAVLEKDGEKAKKPIVSVMGAHSSIFTGKNMIQQEKYMRLYGCIFELFEDFFQRFVLVKYTTPQQQQQLQQQEEAERLLLSQFLSDWNMVKKMVLWFTVPFKEFVSAGLDMRKTPILLEEQPIMLFKELIFERQEIKTLVLHSLLVDLKQPNDENKVTQDKTSSSLPFAKNIVKMLVQMNYSLESDFDPELSELMGPMFVQIAEEEKLKQSKKGQSAAASTTSTNRSSSSTSSFFGSGRLTPTLKYPYRADCGYVGLKNQGATCYLNSLLQSLFFTPVFRRSVFKWRYDPATCGEESRCIPLQLQKLFARLLLSDCRDVETKDLTQSFGWDTRESFVQHDVQELMRVLFDALSATTIPISEIYEGSVSDYVICQKCHRAGGRKDQFLDLQLVVRDVRHLHEAIENYQYEEVLEGENKYMCGQCKEKVDALKGSKLTRLPDVLTLHLKRFDIDYMTMSRVKLNNQVVFPQTLDMSKHMRSSQDIKVPDLDNKHNIFNLNAILMHSGSAGGGHYYAYIKIEDSWYEFNDSSVSKISESHVEKAYGSTSSVANAYMLMYERQYPVSSEYGELLNMSKHEELSLIPTSIREEVENLNVTYRRGQTEYEQKRDKAYFNLYFRSKKYELTLSQTAKVLDVLNEAIKKIGDNSLSSSIEELCVRRFNPFKQTPGEVLNNEHAIKDLDLSREKYSITIGEKPTVDSNNEKSLTLFAVKLVENGETLEDALELVVPSNCSTATLRNAVASKFNLPVQQIAIVRQSFLGNVKYPTIITDQSENICVDHGIAEGDTIYVQHVAEQGTDSLKVLQVLDSKNHQINLVYSIVDTTTANTSEQQVQIDNRKTIQDLKVLIANRSSLNVDEFVIQLGSGETSYTLKDLDERLNQFIDGAKLFVRKGRQISSCQYNVTFYLMEDQRYSESVAQGKFPGTDPSLSAGEAATGRVQTRSASAEAASKYVKWEDKAGVPHSYYNSPNSFIFQKWYDAMLDKSESVLDIKRKLLERAKQEYPTYVTNDSPSFIRLREKLHGRDYPGRILLDDDLPFDTLGSTLSVVPNREIVIERLHFSEELSADDMVLRVAQWKPSKSTLGPIREIIASRNNTLLELKQLIVLTLDSPDELTVEHIHVRKIPYQLISQLRYTQFVSRLQWEDKALSDHSIITNEPWYLVDADLILCKIVSEEPNMMSNINSASKPNEDQPKSKQQNNGPRREGVLKFYPSASKDSAGATTDHKTAEEQDNAETRALKRARDNEGSTL